MPNAYINPAILIWARTEVKLSIGLAADKLNVSQEKLESWEKGEAFPTIKQLYKIAEIYRRPFAVFYFPEPPLHFKPLKDFRKFQQQYLLNEEEEYILQREILLFHRKREIALELYDQLDSEKIEPFKLKGTLHESPADIARKIIGYLNVNHQEITNTGPDYDALNYWKKLLESKSILVFQTTGVPLNIMRGACIANEILPVIIINSNDTPNGRIFSLIHELVHIVLREDGISNFRYRDKELYDRIEVFCNQAAAEVLVPSELLLATSTLKGHNPKEAKWSQTELAGLARQFCVSQEVILRRLLTLGKTSNSYYLEFRNSQNFSRKKATGGNPYRNVIAKNGVLFLNLALQGFHQEKITASSLWDFIHIKISKLPKLEQMLYGKV
jgi:Zn-dependent peptidase ImmA (M78 family)